MRRVNDAHLKILPADHQGRRPHVFVLHTVDAAKNFHLHIIPQRNVTQTQAQHPSLGGRGTKPAFEVARQLLGGWHIGQIVGVLRSVRPKHLQLGKAVEILGRPKIDGLATDENRRRVEVVRRREDGPVIGQLVNAARQRSTHQRRRRNARIACERLRITHSWGLGIHPLSRLTSAGVRRPAAMSSESRRRNAACHSRLVCSGSM